MPTSYELCAGIHTGMLANPSPVLTACVNRYDSKRITGVLVPLTAVCMAYKAACLKLKGIRFTAVR